MNRAVRRDLDWSSLAPLKISARSVAEGAYLGGHRSRRRGGGIEFGGHRGYVPGDDLRWLDRHALMRHGRLLIREFNMDTDREVHLLLDASASMGYKSAPELPDKLTYASLLAAAIAYVATQRGDPVSLDWLGGQAARAFELKHGKQSFERIADALDLASAGGDLSRDQGAIDDKLTVLAQRAARGSLIVLFSDILDLPAGSLDAYCALSTGGRTLFALQVLDPAEATLSFSDAARFVALEGGYQIETDPALVRERYREARAAHQARWEQALTRVGGHFLGVETSHDAITVVRQLLVLLGELRQ